MTSKDNLKTFVSKYVSLTDEEIQYFESLFETRHFEEKECSFVKVKSKNTLTISIQDLRLFF